MTLDPTSQLFQDAIKITGWPQFANIRYRYDTEYTYPRWVCEAFGPCGGLSDEHDPRCWTPAEPNYIADHIIESLAGHHFRVWLEGRGIVVYLLGTGRYRAYLRTHYLEGWKLRPFQNAPTYLECQMKAVVEIG